MTNKLTEYFLNNSNLKYKNGETIIRGDEEPTGIFYVHRGYVAMNAILENGRTITLNIFKSGSYFPMIWALTNSPNTYSYQTISYTEVHRAPKDKTLRFIKDNPDVLFDLTRRILSGVQGLLTNIEHQLTGDSYHRVISAIFLAAKRFGEPTKAGDILLSLPLTHQDIANIAGLTRETTSLALEKLEKKRLLSYRKRHILIPSMEILKKESLIDIHAESVPLIL
jgi:CRP/FNR family transcriptional regulator, cyclic AMP receptor protein